MVVLGVAAGASVLVPAAPAAAHNSLTGSDPADGARVATAPKRIELRFLATPAAGTTKITITGPDDVTASTGTPTFSGKRVAVPFSPGPAGVYIVTYQVMSIDGHEARGKLSFTLTTGATPAAGSPTAPAAPPTTAAASPAPAATSSAPAVSAAAGDGDRGTGWWWALGALVLCAALAAGALLRRRAVPPDRPTGPA